MQDVWILSSEHVSGFGVAIFSGMLIGVILTPIVGAARDEDSDAKEVASVWVHCLLCVASFAFIPCIAVAEATPPVLFGTLAHPHGHGPCVAAATCAATECCGYVADISNTRRRRRRYLGDTAGHEDGVICSIGRRRGKCGSLGVALRFSGYTSCTKNGVYRSHCMASTCGPSSSPRAYTGASPWWRTERDFKPPPGTVEERGSTRSWSLTAKLMQEDQQPLLCDAFHLTSRPYWLVLLAPTPLETTSIPLSHPRGPSPEP